MPSRVIFMGTPEFSVPALQQLAASDLCVISLVVTQPDRPAGRDRKLVSPAVKVAADELGITSVQTSTLRDPDVRQRIIDLQPDLIVVTAFGMILGRWILELPTYGCINLHASVLPKFRGANPIASAIAVGENITGVSLMGMDRGLDTGPVYARTDVSIAHDDTTESLTPKLAKAAAELLNRHLASLLQGTLKAVPQGGGATLTRMMTKNDGWLDFSLSASELERHVRAMWSWPRAWTTNDAGERIQVHAVYVMLETVGQPGEVTHRGKDVIVGTREGSLVLQRVQIPGGRPIEGQAILQCRALSERAFLGKTGGPHEMLPLMELVLT